MTLYDDECTDTLPDMVALSLWELEASPVLGCWWGECQFAGGVNFAEKAGLWRRSVAYRAKRDQNPGTWPSRIDHILAKKD